MAQSAMPPVSARIELLDRINRELNQDIYYQQNFPNDGQRFIAWYLRNIHLRTPVQAKDDIVDGTDDKQIDAILVDDENRQVIIIQGKFYSYTAVDHEPIQEVLSAWAQIQDLQHLQEHANTRLKVKLADLGEVLKEDYEVVFELVTTGNLTKSAEADLEAFQNLIQDYEHPTASMTLVDESTLRTRWDDALSRELPTLNHALSLTPGMYLELKVAGFTTVLAALKLADCLQLPGIREGTLFRKNVRQSLGLTNKVNKGMKQTIQSDSPQYFFLYHNGITALCEKIVLDAKTNRLQLQGLSVVNGCQSLNTILACSEKVRTASDAFVLLRFYEIPQRDLADRISVATNSQSAVKPRDLRSNDKRLLGLKRSYENTYRDGYLITKRGEERPADRDQAKTIDVSLLAKCLMSWQCQRPNIAYSEYKLFDKYFDQLIKSDYSPADILALNYWAQEIEKRWAKNDIPLHETLLAAASYSKNHLLFAIQTCFGMASLQSDKVPAPSATLKALNDPGPIIDLAANCYNSALDMAVGEYPERGKIFSPQNWLKAKDSILKIQAATRLSLGMLAKMPGGADLKKVLTLPPDQFGLRWTAD